MKILLVFIPLFVLFIHKPDTQDDTRNTVHKSVNGNIQVDICGTVPPLCEGGCSDIGTDLILKIDGGAPPYRVRVAFNWTPGAPQSATTFTILDVRDPHVIRFCHDNTQSGPAGEQLLGDTTVFKIPTAYYPGELVFRNIEDSDGCISTQFNGTNPLPMDQLPGVQRDYQADIPSHICDSLMLPPITPSFINVAYYSEPNGNGPRFNPGEVLDFNSINLPSGDLFDTLYIFDPDDICQSQKIIPFTLHLSPNHDTPDDVSQCQPYTLPPYPGPISTPLAQYSLTREPDPLSFTLDPGDVISTSQMIYLRDMISYSSGDCTFLDSFFVEILTQPFAGNSTTQFVCEGETTIIADPRVLLGNPDPGGTWSGTMIPDVDFNNPSNIDLSHMTEGLVYSLIYTIEKPGCPITSSTLIFEAVAPAFAGDSTRVSICREDDPLDFIALLNNPDQGGTWMQTTATTITIPDYNNVDFSNLPENIYTFTYTVPATINCPEQVGELIIDFTSGPNAGMDNGAIVCKGDSLEMNTLLSGDADTNGEFKVDGFILLPDGIWDSNQILLDEGEVNIEYTVGGLSANCGMDTSAFVIQLIQVPFAGVPVMASTQLCEGEIVMLTDLIDGENDGGIFYMGPDFTSAVPNEFSVPDTDNSFAYVIEGGGECESDTSFFSIESDPAPEAELSFITTDICQGQTDCFDFTITTQGQYDFSINVMEIGGADREFDFQQSQQGNSDYTICADKEWVEVSPGSDTLFVGFDLPEFQIEITELYDPVTECTSFPSDLSTSVIINRSDERMLTGTVCEGNTIDIEGMMYGASTTLRLQNEFGCDSIVHIVIDSFPNDIGRIEEQFCAGQPQEILGQTFSNDTSALITFTGMSHFGCDSTAMVDLVFTTVAEGTFTTEICEDGSVTVEGEVFDKDRLTDTIDGPMSVFGCDSTIMVAISILDPGIRTLDTMICKGDFLEIGSDIYDENNTSGMTQLDIPAANTCDSIVMVNLGFLDDIIDARTYTICEGSSISIGNGTYDENKTSGEEKLAGTVGCDTIVTVSVDIIRPEIVTVTDEICPDGMLIVNGISYDADDPTGTSSELNTLGCDSIVYDVSLSISSLSGDITSTLIDQNTYQLLFSGSVSNASLSWSPSDILDCSIDCVNPIATIDADTEIELMITDEDGCVHAFSTTLIKEEIVEPDSTIIIYEANMMDITDPLNSIFHIQSNFETTIHSFQVFDRWGNQVFFNENFLSNDPGEGWDGRYGSGSAVEQGVYVYRVEYDNGAQGRALFFGSITLLR